MVDCQTATGNCLTQITRCHQQRLSSLGSGAAARTGIRVQAAAARTCFLAQLLLDALLGLCKRRHLFLRVVFLCRSRHRRRLLACRQRLAACVGPNQPMFQTWLCVIASHTPAGNTACEEIKKQRQGNGSSGQQLLTRSPVKPEEQMNGNKA